MRGHDNWKKRVLAFNDRLTGRSALDGLGYVV